MEVIALVPEASGICYSTRTDTLFVVNDEGKIYEVSKNGKILCAKQLGKYDLEGVACDDVAKRLYFAVEGKDNILIVDQRTLQVLKEMDVDRVYHGKKLLIKDKEQGLEGIALVNDRIYLANQS
ncbi:MAG: SdiA-regulated domain-containing protein [Campylobacterales bacterium]|nr:SdiA-regulated domain-containing protein [Campylobacterales bacterium]